MGHICPWRRAYLFDNPLRRLVHSPPKLFGPHVRAGMTVMDVGCGMGFNAIGLARLVGPDGCVIAVDVRQEMIDVLRKRAARAGVAARIRTHHCEPDQLGIDAAVGFVSAFWVVHEAPDARVFLGQVHSRMNAGAKLFVAEPRLHVSGADFQGMLAAAEDVGLRLCDEPRVRLSRAAVFLKE